MPGLAYGLRQSGEQPLSQPNGILNVMAQNRVQVPEQKYIGPSRESAAKIFTRQHHGLAMPAQTLLH